MFVDVMRVVKVSFNCNVVLFLCWLVVVMKFSVKRVSE